MTEAKIALLSMLNVTPLIMSGGDKSEEHLIAAGKELRQEGKIEMAEDPRRKLFAMKITAAGRSALSASQSTSREGESRG